jgi:hypothetical protein
MLNDGFFSRAVYTNKDVEIGERKSFVVGYCVHGLGGLSGLCW